MKQRAVLFANGDIYEPAYARSLLAEGDLFIAANGGMRVARALGIVPDLLIGDSDSLPGELQSWLETHDVSRVSHPAEKDETDLELALRYVIELGIRSVLFLGVTGSRLDHTLANISLLALAQQAGMQAEIVVARQHLRLVYDSVVIKGEVGQTVSLLPLGGDVEGVRTQGLRWELDGATLPFGPARGISNLMRGDRATITLERGMLLVVQQYGEVL